jgi:hypothetical protein
MTMAYPEPDDRCNATADGSRCILKVHSNAEPHRFSGAHPMRPVDYSDSLRSWWNQTSESDWEAFGPKLAEYGARDLIEHGYAILTMRRTEARELFTEGYAGEVGCMFYLHGKMARVMEAYVAGREPSSDTLKDIETYARMARAFRERGGLK